MFGWCWKWYYVRTQQKNLLISRVFVKTYLFIEFKIYTVRVFCWSAFRLTKECICAAVVTSPWIETYDTVLTAYPDRFRTLKNSLSNPTKEYYNACQLASVCLFISCYCTLLHGNFITVYFSILKHEASGCEGKRLAKLVYKEWMDGPNQGIGHIADNDDSLST
jgi:hypothetical protein